MTTEAIIDELKAIRESMTSIFNCGESLFIAPIETKRTPFGRGAFIQGLETEEDDNMTAIYYWSPPSSFLDYHVHEHQDELFIVVRGSVILYVQGKIVDLKRGDCYYIPRGKYHAAVFDAHVETKLMLVYKPAFDDNVYNAKMKDDE